MRIFSQNATKREEVADADYKKGAASLGKDPLNTTRWYFNSLFRTADLKKDEINKKVQAAESKGKLETTDKAEQELTDAESVVVTSIDTSKQEKENAANESAAANNKKSIDALATTAADMKATISNINASLNDFKEDYTDEIAEINKKKEQLQSMIASIGGDKIQGYLYDDMEAVAGASYSLIGISQRYKLYCNQSGNTKKMDVGSFNPSDGATITIGTAKFTFYIESLGLPLTGKLSVLGNPFTKNDDGYIIDPFTGTALIHRKVITCNNDFYIRCVGGKIYTAQYESRTPLYESFDSKNYSFNYVAKHAHGVSFTTEENNESVSPSVHSHKAFEGSQQAVPDGCRALQFGYSSDYKHINHSSTETYNGKFTYFAKSSETLKGINSDAKDTVPTEIQTKTITTADSGAHKHRTDARTKNPIGGVDSFYMIDYIKPKSVNLLVVEYV